jgi:hypothetical protein
VRSSEVGLDPGTVEVYYTTDYTNGGGTWTQWTDVDGTGSTGTKDWVTLVAHDVPFNQVGSDQNRIKFKITDTYSGTYYRGPRTDQMQFPVEISEIHDAGAAGSGGANDSGTGTGGSGGTGASAIDAGDDSGSSGGGSGTGESSWDANSEEGNGCACSAAGQRRNPVPPAWALGLVALIFCTRRGDAGRGSPRARRV